MKNLIVNIFKTLFFFDLALIIIAVIPDFKTENAAFLTLWREGMALLVVSVISIFYYTKFEKEKIPKNFKKANKKNKVKSKRKPKGRIKFSVLGLLCGIAIPLLFTVAMRILKGYNFVCFNKIPQIWIWIIAIFFNSLAGELLIRGHLFRLYKKHYGFIFATIFTTLLFLSMHLEILDVNKSYATTIILLNVLLCFLLEITKSIYFTIFARFSYCIISGFIFGGELFVEKYPVLANYVFKGKTALTGGEYMVEGSNLTLIFLSIVIFVIFALKYKIWQYFTKAKFEFYIRTIKLFFLGIKDYIVYILLRIRDSFRIIPRRR